MSTIGLLQTPLEEYHLEPGSRLLGMGHLLYLVAPSTQTVQSCRSLLELHSLHPDVFGDELGDIVLPVPCFQVHNGMLFRVQSILELAYL